MRALILKNLLPGEQESLLDQAFPKVREFFLRYFREWEWRIVKTDFEVKTERAKVLAGNTLIDGIIVDRNLAVSIANQHLQGENLCIICVDYHLPVFSIDTRMFAGAASVAVVSGLGSVDGYVNTIIHEILHALFYKLGVKDITHDLAQNLTGFAEGMDSIRGRLSELEGRRKTTAEIIEDLKRRVLELIALLALFMKRGKIELWASAIREYEGYFPPGTDHPNGSRSYRNNNPGNLHYAGQVGSVGKDDKGFAIFSSYEAGWQALVRQLELAVSGRSRVYRPDMTLLEFFQTYAPSSDGNHPKKYADFVAVKLGVTPSVKVGDLRWYN